MEVSQKNYKYNSQRDLPSSPVGMGSIPGQETKIPHAEWHGQKKKKKKKKKNLL